MKTTTRAFDLKNKDSLEVVKLTRLIIGYMCNLSIKTRLQYTQTNIVNIPTVEWNELTRHLIIGRP